MMKNNKSWNILYVLYAIAFVLNVYTAIKYKNIAYIGVCIWILNSMIMFACARMNEKRADKFQKLYFDGIEKDIKEKCDKFKELTKRQ